MTGEIADEESGLALSDICERCGVSEAQVLAYVEEGVVEVEGDDVARWTFSTLHLVRIRKARRLERDLRLNPAGAALALELMAEIEDLKSRLRRFEKN